MLDIVFIVKHISKLKILYLIGGCILPLALIKINRDGLQPVFSSLAGFGVLVTKYDILVEAQLIPPFKGFREAFIDSGLDFKYVPSSTEWLISLFLLATAVAIFYFLHRFFISLRILEE